MIARLISTPLACFTLTFAGSLAAQALPPMPVPHSNNAVAAVGSGDETRFFSFMGLTQGKTYADISRQAYQFCWSSRQWTRIPDVPVPSGRLASTAVAVGRKIYLFGGYSVAANGDEESTPEVLAFDPVTWRYERRAPMPVPVDDSVSVAYADRYIYLISGWHDTGNSAFVQVYDTKEDRWFRATDWPGAPVFGHSGGIAGNRMVIADGVTATKDQKSGRNRFAIAPQAWLGEIAANDPSVIRWSKLPDHPGPARYRMASSGSANRIVFTGGSPVAYNYNGQGYDGTPAPASSNIFAYDVVKQAWLDLGDKPIATMDHRGLLTFGSDFYTVGGMDGERRVIGDLQSIGLPVEP